MQSDPRISYESFSRFPRPKTNGLSVASLVLGIIADSLLVITFCIFPYLSLPCSIIGFILGIVGYKKQPTGVGIAGMVTNVIGLILSSTAMLFAVGILFFWR